jgi:prevent-host-death family protein
VPSSIATAELRKRYNLLVVTVIPQRQLRNNNAEILDRVEAGERFVVTRNGVAVADVVPHTSQPGPPRFPKTSDLLARNRVSGATAPDREASMRDIRDADTFIDDDPFTGRA